MSARAHTRTQTQTPLPTDSLAPASKRARMGGGGEARGEGEGGGGGGGKGELRATAFAVGSEEEWNEMFHRLDRYATLHGHVRDGSELRLGFRLGFRDAGKIGCRSVAADVCSFCSLVVLALNTPPL